MRNFVLVMLVCLIVYHVNGRPHPEVDCLVAPYTAWSLAQRGALDVGVYPELARLGPTQVRRLPDGTKVSIRPPGTALTVVPVIAPFAWLRQRPFSDLAMLQLGKLAAALCVALASGVFFRICRRVAPSAAWPGTALFAFGTCLWPVASQALWMHGPATLWLCVALYLLLEAKEQPAAAYAVAGLALGLATLSRPSAAFFVVATVGASIAVRRWRGLLWLLLGGLPLVAWLIFLNITQFGAPLRGGYLGDNWQEAPPWYLGLGGLLIAPSRGVLIYTPALLLAPAGLLCLWKDRRHDVCRSMITSWSMAAAATLVFYAHWYEWRGGWCFGPRFLCETMPVCCLLFAIAYQHVHHRILRHAAVGLVALSVAVQFVGVFGHSGYVAWQERHERHDLGRCLFELHDTQIAAHTRAFFNKLHGKKP